LYMHPDVARNLTAIAGDFPQYLIQEWSSHWAYEGMIHRPIHWDGPMATYSCMVDGAKTWSLWPPEFVAVFQPQLERLDDCCVNRFRHDMATDPVKDMYDWFDHNLRNHGLAKVAPEPLHVKVEAGDCLLMPRLWIHATRYHGRGLGVDFSFDQLKEPTSPEERRALDEVRVDPAAAVIELQTGVIVTGREKGVLHGGQKPRRPQGKSVGGWQWGTSDGRRPHSKADSLIHEARASFRKSTADQYLEDIWRMPEMQALVRVRRPPMAWKHLVHESRQHREHGPRAKGASI